MIEVKGPRGEIAIRLAGTFDGAAAKRLCGRLRELPPDADVVVDFGAVRDVDDHGLVLVAGAIGDRPGSVAVRGLGRHQERILRYVGVDLEHASREADAR